ncbi:hypothetical protein [Morganella morganii]|uniref:hypothetical protein n=1 Tax=Morganella morganii TaxID=582 RepID=UPI003EB98427
MSKIYLLIIPYLIYQIYSDQYYKKNKIRTTTLELIKLMFKSIIDFVLKSLSKIFFLNENSLAKQPIFWIGTLSPLILATWLEYHIIMLDKSLLSITRASDLVKESGLPIYISAVTPMLGVFISNIHRTIQTKAQINKTEIQIEEAAKKNIIDGFYSHVRYITEEFSNIKNDIHIYDIPLHFLSFHIPYAKDTSFYDAFSENKLQDIKIDLTIKHPKSLYHYIYKKSSIISGFSIEVNSVFIEDVREILDNLFYISSELKECIITDNAGYPISITRLKSKDFIAERLSQLLNVNKMNSLLSFNEFNIKCVEPMTIYHIINSLFSLSTIDLGDSDIQLKIEKHIKLQKRYLSKFLEYYGVCILNYTNFIVKILEVIENNDNDIFDKSNTTIQNAKRMISVSEILNYELDTRSHFDKYLKST